jgi:arabinogalactan endo-1,4-beta-galactosidase
MNSTLKPEFPVPSVFKLLLVGLLFLPAAAPAAGADFAKGADVGWLSQMEASSIKFRDAAGAPRDCLQILKDWGINSIRFRVWVDPTGGWCGQADVVKMAVRAKNLGFRIMIDFHYSDWWADPGKQNKPHAWSRHGIAQLKADVSDHTATVLRALKAAGVAPEWVQVGNETNDGMLWEEGRASKRMSDFAGLVTSGYDAIKSVFPDAKVIVHVSNGYDSKMFRWMFDGLTAAGAKFDVIGMSLYPTVDNWPALTAQCLANMNDMVARYGREVMVCEVGMDVNAAAACKAFLMDIIAKTRSVSGGKGLGVFYWEPESHDNWQGYTLGAFDPSGRPTIAMDAFKD